MTNWTCLSCGATVPIPTLRQESPVRCLICQTWMSPGVTPFVPGETFTVASTYIVNPGPAETVQVDTTDGSSDARVVAKGAPTCEN